LVLAQFTRDAGKRVEPELFALWGGSPTTRLLRHRDASNRTTLERWHGRLRMLMETVRIPTQAEEAADPQGADQVYQSCVAFLKERTRDHSKFALVFAENCSYGFRRNTWGLRRIGISSTLVGMVVVGACVFVATHTRME